MRNFQEIQNTISLSEGKQNESFAKVSAKIPLCILEFKWHVYVARWNFYARSSGKKFLTEGTQSLNYLFSKPLIINCEFVSC